MTEFRRTGRWRPAVPAAAVLVAAGVYLGDAGVLLAAAVPAAYAAYPWLSRPPAVSLSLTRTATPASPDHGDRVTVEATLTNDGRSVLPAVEFADGVPDHLVVVEGSPRGAAALRPGESTTVRYDVVAKRGTHAFDPADVTVRDVSGGHEATLSVAGDDAGATELACPPSAPEGGVPSRAGRYPGRGDAASFDAGVEFARVREYRPGDSPGRIDWRRYARDRKLTTVESPAQRAATLVLCLDARPCAFRSAGAGEPHAVAYAADAARAVGEAALDRGDRVGLAVVGESFEWIPPSGRPLTERGVGATLDEHAVAKPPARPPTPGAPGDREGLLAALPQDAHAVWFAPLVGEYVAGTARRLAAAGRDVTVVSPDVTTAATAGGRVARVERDARIAALRNAGIPVADWDPAEPLAAAFARAGLGGSP
ncbi:DUF58 domain-containing protein [Halostella litorea]|uniref:DUF58 domain-containing protein n=1 Tax=Halostella litorea TaxID=2528831 RepID=UPI001092595D|nr:DUF58 domain-containing protein [Halostella litorea]